MNKSSGHVTLLLGLLWMLAIGGCTAAAHRGPTWPFQVVDLEPRVDFRRYTTLVVKDFQNAVGDALSNEVLKQLPEAVIVHLNKCYPGAFVKIERTAVGSAEELVVEGTITEYLDLQGSRLVRVLIPAGTARMSSNVLLADGQSTRKLTEIKVTLQWAAGCLVCNPISLTWLGGFVGIENLVEEAGRGIADALAEKRGMTILSKRELLSSPEAWRSAAQDRTKEERCYR